MIPRTVKSDGKWERREPKGKQKVKNTGAWVS